MSGLNPAGQQLFAVWQILNAVVAYVVMGQLPGLARASRDYEQRTLLLPVW